MSKKLQKSEYKSKAQFQADLNLIFINCRTYNTTPEGKIYVTHADALEKKAKELMKDVRNIDLHLRFIFTVYNHPAYSSLFQPE